MDLMCEGAGGKKRDPNNKQREKIYKYEHLFKKTKENKLEKCLQKMLFQR